MFARLTTTGCRVSRQIYREVTAVNPGHHGQVKSLPNTAAAVCTMRVAAIVDGEYRQDSRRANFLDQRNPGHHGRAGARQICGRSRLAPLIVTREFASKAASKFGKKIKKETFDRYHGMDPSRIQHGFDEVRELEDASEDVRRIFSLEFAPGREIRRLHEADTFQELDIDRFDRGYSNFLVTSIAKLTVSIRNLAPHVERFPRDKRNKRQMLLMIDRRRKHIKFLRRTNFDLANRLLEKLDLEFTPGPRHVQRRTKRNVEKKTLCKQAHTERMQALEEFTGKLREEQFREIAELKRDLGMELTEEETGRLQQDNV